MFRFVAALTVFLSVSPALAADVGGSGGFASGFLHPILGFDHLLAMVAVGLLSVQIGGRAVWIVPLAFVLFLGAGGAMGLFGIPLPEVEGAIAMSVLALGVAIAFQTRLPLLLAIAFVGFFAIFHGHAHGEEIPTLADPWTYVAGFMLASTLLHLTGVGLGLLGCRPQLRAHFGSACAGIGAHLLLLTYGIV